MKRVVLIGLDPATVDFSDPALPPCLTAEKIHAGVKLALADFAARGWHAQNCFINPDETAVATVERCLAGQVCDCVVVGAGLRLLPSRLLLFEAVVNAIRRAAPQAAIQHPPRGHRCGSRALGLTREFATRLVTDRLREAKVHKGRRTASAVPRIGDENLTPAAFFASNQGFLMLSTENFIDLQK